MKAVAAIKRFFEAEPYGRQVTMGEFQDLAKEDRQELGRFACVELGVEFEATV